MSEVMEATGKPEPETMLERDRRGNRSYDGTNIAIHPSELGKHEMNVINALIARKEIDDPIVRTDCDGTQTVTIDSTDEDGILTTRRFTFPKPYLEDGPDSGFVPVLDTETSQYSMLLDSHREMLLTSWPYSNDEDLIE